MLYSNPHAQLLLCAGSGPAVDSVANVYSQVQRWQDGLQASCAAMAGWAAGIKVDSNSHPRLRGLMAAAVLRSRRLMGSDKNLVGRRPDKQGKVIDIITAIHKTMRFKIRNVAASLLISNIRSNIRNENLETNASVNFFNVTSHSDKTLPKMAQFLHKSFKIWKLYNSRMKSKSNTISLTFVRSDSESLFSLSNSFIFLVGL